MFIGRERELQELENMYPGTQFQMPVIYGRRRVGKTTLIRKFTEGKNTIFFTAVESTIDKNLELFSKSIYRTLLPGHSSLPPFLSFEMAFDFITKHARKERLILVIDEFPYLAASDKSICSRLQAFIDNFWAGSRLYLILCGSSTNFMENQILGRQSPFYGRYTAQFQILPFDYRTAAHFFPDYSAEDKALVYGVVGGIPKYLELFSPELSVHENIVQLFFNDSGYLYEEPGNLLRQELRDISTYNAIIEALASGAARINEIVTKTHTDTATASYCLKSLISIGIIEKESAITEENNRKKTYYTIRDNMFRFWYRFVPNGTASISMQEGSSYFEDVVLPGLSDYMKLVFEQMCKNYLMYIHLNGTQNCRITKIGRWWGINSRLRQEEQIDIVGVNPTTKFALLGECLYQNSNIQLDTAKTLLDKGTLIPGYPVKQYVLCSKNNFTSSVSHFAEENSIHLITLQDLYE